jgi:hypothetical protein
LNILLNARKCLIGFFFLSFGLNSIYSIKFKHINLCTTTWYNTGLNRKSKSYVNSFPVKAQCSTTRISTKERCGHFNFMNYRFLLHEFTISTSRIHEVESWIREVEIANSWSWNRDIIFTHVRETINEHVLIMNYHSESINAHLCSIQVMLK